MKQRFSIELQGDIAQRYGAGTIYYQPLRMNAALKEKEAVKNGERVDSDAEALKCVSDVQGLIDPETGQAVTVDQIKSKDIYPDLFTVIMIGYQCWIEETMKKENVQKNFKLVV